MLYDENTNYMNNKVFRSVHRIDYWSGYYSNKGQHKALIKSAFHKWMVTQNLYELASLTRCTDVASLDSDPASQLFYKNVCSPIARSKYEQKMLRLSHTIPVGAHHDSITGTSKEIVHSEEKAKFVAAVTELDGLLNNLFVDYFNLKVIPGTRPSSDALTEQLNFFQLKGVKGISQQIIYNGALRARSALPRFYLPKPPAGQSITVRFNNEPVASTLQRNFQCDYLLVHEDEKQVSLVVELPEVKPMSMNLLTVELRNETEAAGQEKVSSYSDVQQLSAAASKVLENEELRVELDEQGGSYLPSQIYFKELDVAVDVETQFVRYPATVTDSGAYIFAPRSRAVPLHLDVIDAKLLNTERGGEGDHYVQKKLVIFFRSHYLHQCFSLMTVTLNQNSNKGQLTVEYKGNILQNDELYLRMKLRPRLAAGAKMAGSQFYVHDSVANVRRDLYEKRYVMSRDVGSKYYPMVEGASYRYQVNDPKEGEQDYILAFFTGTRSNGVGYVEDGVIDLGVGRNLNNDDFKGLPDGTLDNSIQELSFSISLFKAKDIMGFGSGAEATKARKEYELYHLDKSSPVFALGLTNYLVDIEMGEYDAFGPRKPLGAPLKTDVSFFHDPEDEHQGDGRQAKAPAEIIEIQQDGGRGGRYVATYLSKNGERLQAIGHSEDAKFDIQELERDTYTGSERPQSDHGDVELQAHLSRDYSYRTLEGELFHEYASDSGRTKKQRTAIEVRKAVISRRRQ